MKTLLVYSSRTGNTEKVARAIFEALPGPKDILSVKQDPAVDGYDLIIMGFWVDKGTADAGSRAFFKSVKNRKIALFGTLGADPDSDHARDCMARVNELVKDNEVLGRFLCQGKVDPKLIEMMATRMKDDPHHSMTPERRARLDEAATHPDQADLDRAARVFSDIAATLAKDGKR